MNTMGTPQDLRRTDPYIRRSGALPSEHCRQALQILRGHTDGITVTELADRLAAADESAAETDASAVDSLRIRLHHCDVPKWADMGLIEWDRASQTVSLADHTVSDGREPGSAADREPAVPTIDSERRRELLAIVESVDGSISREDLARELASTDGDGEPTDARIENVAVRLHHCRLPELEDAGLLEYDCAAGTITYQGPSEVPPAAKAASDD